MQVELHIDTQTPISQGKMADDGSDIRFGYLCDGSKPIQYWIESGINTGDTKIWVNVELDALQTVEIYLFSGNPLVTSESTLDVFNGPNSSTDSVTVGSTNTVSDCQRGFRFSANEDILIASFGKKIPNATQRYVTMFNFTTQAIVAQTTVSAGTAGQWNYSLLANPFWIPSGQQYLLELHNATSDMYYYGTTSQIGEHLTYYDMRYCNGCSENTFPTITLTNYHYGLPDLLYYTRTHPTSEPSVDILYGQGCYVGCDPDQTPPEITAPGPVVVSTDPGTCYASAAPSRLGTPLVSDNCSEPDELIVTLSPSTVPRGTSNVTWTVTDKAGNYATAQQQVTVIDTEAPDTYVLLNPTTLYPVDQQMRPVHAYVNVVDNCKGGTTFSLLDIRSNQPDAGMEPSDLPNDIQGASIGTPDADFLLRAEQFGLGRWYTVWYQGFDGDGNTATAYAVAGVPFNGGGWGNWGGFWNTPKDGVIGDHSAIPSEMSLDQNFPNPFNPATSITYRIPQDGNVSLAVYDMYSRKVATVVNTFQNAGTYTAHFTATNLTSGTYVYVLEANGITLKRSMTLMK